MKRSKLWIAIIIVIIVVTALMIWTRSHLADRWLVIVAWAVVIIVLQLMFIDLIVFKNRKNKKGGN